MKRRKNISVKELVTKYGDNFTDLYINQKLSVARIAPILDISNWNGYQIKRYLDLQEPKQWQKIGMPEKFSDECLEVLYGTLLGDASLCSSGTAKNRYFSISHSPKQKKFIEYKRNQLLELKPREIKPSGDKWGTLRFMILSHPEFNKLYKEFYPNGKKIISMDILNKLTPKSMAFWFMDDGFLLNKNSGLGLATCGFTNKCHNKIRDYFYNNWGLSVKIYKYKYTKINIFSSSAVKFKKIIEPHVIPEMQYKLNLNSGIGSRGHKR